MIFILPKWRALPVIVAVTVVCLSLSLPLVSGMPASYKLEGTESGRNCRETLLEQLQWMCTGQMALGLTHVSGRRNSNPEDRSPQGGLMYRCCIKPCTRTELFEFCPPD